MQVYAQKAPRYNAFGAGGFGFGGNPWGGNQFGMTAPAKSQPA